MLEATREPVSVRANDRALRLAEHGAVAIAAAYWVLILTPSSGGFHDIRTAGLILLMVPGLLLTQPWRHAPVPALVIVPLMAFGALLVLSTTATGWAQADSVADQLAGGLALVLIASYARTEQRRLAVAAVLAVALAVECYQAWLAWWGSGNPNTLVTATFYWHNQTGAYAGALACLIAAVAVWARRSVAAGAAILAAMGIGIVVLTTSRAALGLLALGLVALLALANRRPSINKTARWTGVLVLAAGLLLLFTSRPFFPQHSWAGPPLLGSATSTSGGSGSASSAPAGRGVDTLSGNGGARAIFTEAALRAWVEAPIQGNGFGSFAVTSPPLIHGRTGLSAFVHNGYAEALTSGGLLFGAPLLVGIVLLAGRALRALLRPATAPGLARGITVGSAVGALLLLAHSGVDFDWHYTSLAVVLGVLAGVVTVSTHTRTPRPWAAAATAVALIATAALGTTAVLVEHHGRQAVQAANASPAGLLDAQLPLAYDPRLAEQALARSFKDQCQLAVPPATARQVYAATQRIGRLDPTVRQLRDRLHRLADGSSAPSADCT